MRGSRRRCHGLPPRKRSAAGQGLKWMSRSVRRVLFRGLPDLHLLDQ